MLDWRELMRDPEAWTAATETLDAAEEARDWLTDTIMAIDQQFADNRTIGRIPDDEWADHLDWRAAASAFKRRCVQRKRELDRRIKQINRERSEADRAAYLEQAGVAHMKWAIENGWTPPTTTDRETP